MREIKFRVWNKKHKVMETYLDHFAESYSYSADDNTFQFDSESEDYVLMQYTGLKDKNGFEIYEGDIVSQGDWLGEVKWIRDFWGTGEGHYDDEGLYDDCSQVEVIGNIYENPTLKGVSSNQHEGKEDVTL